MKSIEKSDIYDIGMIYGCVSRSADKKLDLIMSVIEEKIYDAYCMGDGCGVIVNFEI